MPFSYDLSATTGKIRLLIPDNQPVGYVFEDAEIEAFYAMEGNVRRAAALALETIASNETMVLKVIKLLDIQTDGAKVADALFERAGRLRSQAEDDEAIDNAGFDIAEMVVDQFTYREKSLNSFLLWGI